MYFIFLKVHKFFLKTTKTKNKTNVVSFIFICIFVDFVIKLSSLKVHKYVQLSIKCVFTSFVFPDQLSNKILENCVQRTMFIDLNNVQRMVFIVVFLVVQLQLLRSRLTIWGSSFVKIAKLIVVKFTLPHKHTTHVPGYIARMTTMLMRTETLARTRV